MVSEHASPLAVLGGVDAGGQNVHVAELARALARRGIDVVVHTRRDDPSQPRRVALGPGVEVDHVDAGPARVLPKDALLPYMDAFAEELHSAWSDERPDAVHSHFWMSGLAALDAVQPLGVPVAHTFHALGSVKQRHQGARDTSPSGRIGIERRIARRVDRVVATCSDELFELLRLGADRRRISVVPCGVDRETFSPAAPAEPRLRDGRFRLVMATRLVERKGVDDAVRALARMDPARPAELHVAGGPDAGELDTHPEARRLRELAAQLGVADRLVLRGRVDREALPGLLRSADVVVCAPWYEPFGIVPLEAMACGIPVVATVVGGQIDSVVHGVSGLHVPSRDPRAVVIGDALLDRDLHGVAERLAPDAPVPVVDQPVERARPGGAALAAVLAGGLGVEVTLVCALGDDEAGRRVAALLRERGVVVCDLGSDGGTPEKVRIHASGRPLVRLDHGGPPGRPGPLSAESRAALGAADAVLVSDYGRGLPAHPEVRAALGGAARHPDRVGSAPARSRAGGGGDARHAQLQ